MPSSYNIKPLFQTLLRPLVKRLQQRNVSPNAVTLFSLGMSVVFGLLFCLLPSSSIVLFALPVILLVRMALNAMDGLLAKEFHQATPLGALLNELSDIGSDTALYLPFALIPGIYSPLVIFIVLLSIATEVSGLCPLLIGASRRYDGPMGKSDRAIAFGALAIVLGFYGSAAWINGFLGLLIILLLLTIANRSYKALEEIGSDNVAQ